MVMAGGSWVSELLSQSGTHVGQSMFSGTHGGEEGSAQMWKALPYFLALPDVGSMLNVFLKSHHREHGEPQVHRLPHSCTRSKPFPRRDDSHTLFHNSHMNPLPTTYENE
ncbi:cytochrome c oxidase subunit 6A1, mitochondrial-like [Mustela lutreola]|uniref:cytochrome c oxidase subunit 6A1, mitochondrial-like n=1 Tax=Mustela lutreola TaxID=9666 RepID=UPI0027970030|nr:cytochrome c oxidase subunit 6A1, mitochondrial-like [Mustela lutreola]